MRVVRRSSPNRDERPAGAAVDMLVLHYTGMPTAEAALDRLRDPGARVSAHYLVDEDGLVAALVPEECRAWHAGASWWQGRANLNDVSIGIELVNPGHEGGYRPFPEPQMAALVELAAGLVGRWGIPAGRVVAHSDIAPTRKDDPGELFDWRRLAPAGLGLWPPVSPWLSPEPTQAAAALARIGYPGEAQGVPLPAALRAFQRRFRPTGCDGRLDGETMGLVAAVADLCASAGAATLGVASGGRMAAPASAGEESPGSTGTRCRVTPGGGDPRESATESRPPAGAGFGRACGQG